MKTKNTLIVSFINLLFLLSIPVISAADSHLDYYSLHDELVKITYTDATGKLKQEVRQGFFEVYDIEDPKVACNTELDCPFGTSSDIISLPSIILGSPGVSPPSSKKKQFRVFIPEGTVEIKLALFCQQSGLLASVVKYDALPDGVQLSTPFQNTAFTQEDSFAFGTFKSNEVYLQNAGGHINIYTKALQAPDASGTNPPWPKGGWLYINNYLNDAAIGQIQFGMKVHKDTFLNWFNTYKNAVNTDSSLDTFGLLSGSSIKPDPGDPGTVITDPPVTGTDLAVSLTPSPATGESPLLVTFMPTITGGTAPFSYTWNFGDGSTGTQEPTTAGIGHTFDKDGTYYVTLTVTDKNGTTAVSTAQVSAAPIQNYDDGYTEGYAAGKKYCSENPVACGIITIEDSYDISLNSVDYTIPGIPGGPWDLQLKLINGNWILDTVTKTPSPATTTP